MKKLLITLSLILVGMTSCQKEEPVSPIPTIQTSNQIHRRGLIIENGILLSPLNNYQVGYVNFLSIYKGAIVRIACSSESIIIPICLPTITLTDSVATVIGVYTFDSIPDGEYIEWVVP